MRDVLTDLDIIVLCTSRIVLAAESWEYARGDQLRNSELYQPEPENPHNASMPEPFYVIAKPKSTTENS